MFSSSVFPLIVVATIIVLVALAQWQRAVLFFMMWFLVEGAVRKWVPGLGKAGFFIGHLIIGGAYLGYLNDRLRRGARLIPPAPFNWVLLALLVWGTLQVVNPASLGISVWLLGMVTYFFFIPLAYMIPAVFPSKQRLLSFLEWFTFACIPILVLGVIQYYLPVSSILNVLPWGGVQAAAFVGRHVRISATFANSGAYAVFLTFLILLTLYLISLKGRSRKSLIVLYFVLSGAFLNAFMTGSRGAVGFAVISGAMFVVLSGMISLSTLRWWLPRLITAAIFLIVIFTQTAMGREAIMSLQSRGTRDIGERLSLAMKFYRFAPMAGLMGIGLGATYQGRQEIAEGEVAPGTHDEIDRIFVELGPIGFLLAYGLRFVIVWQFWLLFRRLQDHELRLLALIGFLYGLSTLNGSLVFNYVVQKLFWFDAGLLLLLPRLDSASPSRKP
jgi:hypothetical protein